MNEKNVENLVEKLGIEDSLILLIIISFLKEKNPSNLPIPKIAERYIKHYGFINKEFDLNVFADQVQFIGEMGFFSRKYEGGKALTEIIDYSLVQLEEDLLARLRILGLEIDPP